MGGDGTYNNSWTELRWASKVLLNVFWLLKLSTNDLYISLFESAKQVVNLRPFSSWSRFRLQIVNIMQLI